MSLYNLMAREYSLASRLSFNADWFQWLRAFENTVGTSLMY